MTATPNTDNLENDPTNKTAPILTLRNAVLFPGTVMPLVVGRPKTLSLLADISGTNSLIGIVTQKDRAIDDPQPDDLYTVGTLARALKVVQETGQGSHILVQGIRRFRIRNFVQSDPYLVAEIEDCEEISRDDVEVDALMRNVREAAAEMLSILPEAPPAAAEMIQRAEPASNLAYLVVSNIPIPIEEKMKVLEINDTGEILRQALEILQRQIEVLRVSQKINSEVKGDLSKAQREYVLRKQLDAVKKELAEIGVEEDDALDELRRKLEDAGLPEEVKKVADKELARLRTIQPASPEYTVARTYLDWLAALPWNKTTEEKLSIQFARETLDSRHYGLDNVKKRILEFLAVRKLKADMRGPILCLVGPPGVGKTSLGQSVAEALGRKFVRISLGGVRDEAEIRGHRRTYIGAMPGKIIQSLKKAETNSPVFVLDEVDKLGKDWRGDPTSALLEVLDPEQNSTFVDHYLDVQFDLSKVMFIATANRLDTIPPPLLDRMDIIEIPGYTREEKLHIAEQHLLPKQLREHGLTEQNVNFPQEMLELVIERYTREAGVRSLERRIADICRSAAVAFVESEQVHTEVTEDKLSEILGPHKFELDVVQRTEVAGVATALAWTPTGGDILFVEVARMPGKGRVRITGQLGDVMKESCELAVSFARSRADAYGIDKKIFVENDFHIHVPSGAMPKDGPSAGVTIFTALISLLTGHRVRHDVGMTGEITLRGLVLPIGGVKDKVLAAQRSGITKVILPGRNRKDVPDIPESVREQMQICFADSVDDVLRESLDATDGMPVFDRMAPTSSFVGSA
ncbi:MAG: endopeptidase La [Myxococcales bacterium]|nr:endopeptidase La [Myxococcales bacterium]